MDHTIGALVFSKSVDSSIDLPALALAMNNIGWNDLDGSWEVADSGDLLVYTRVIARNPTLRPEFDWNECLDRSTSVYYERHAKDMTDEDWANYVYSNHRPYLLEELRDLLLPHVSRGWFEIAYGSFKPEQHVAFGSLRLTAEGRVTRVLVESGHLNGPIYNRQEL
jgi:hypothetical protein